MASVKTVSRALLALLALTAARHTPPLAAPAAVTTPVTPTIKTGVEKWRAGDYAAAVAIWTPFATAGDADALFNLGQAYKLGRGVTADPAMARDYYRRAAVKGHLPAQANLGIALFQAGEKPEAIKWLRTAADRGEARAQYVLGIAAFNGDGVPRSQSLGYGYLLRAQASGLPQAVTALGTIAPGLSPADRTAGEAVAASLAAGSGVPAALAAGSAPRLINGQPVRPATGLPVTTPPQPATAPASVPAPAPASPAPTATAPASPAPVPTAVTTTIRVPARPAPAAATPVLPPAPRPTPPVPFREPTPAQADASAGVPPPRPVVATVDVPGSRLAANDAPKAADPPAAKATDPLAAKPADPLAARATDPLAAKPADPLAPPAARPRPGTPLRPVETAAQPARPFVASQPAKPFEVAASPAKPDGWRVQLGAFSARRLADAAWADVRATAAPATPIFATDGPVTKLQMGPFATRDAAKAACAKLTAAGRACFVTAG